MQNCFVKLILKYKNFEKFKTKIIQVFIKIILVRVYYQVNVQQNKYDIKELKFCGSRIDIW